jgi:hypothetical protein
MSGVAMQRSKSMLPAWTVSTRSSAPTTSAPAARASSALSPRAKTATRTVRAGAVGQVDHAADHLVGVTRVDAEIHRDFDGLVELGNGAFLDQRHSITERVELVAVNAFVDLLHALSILAMVLSRHFQAHGAGGALDHCHRAFDVGGVEILHLDFGDRADLVAR